MKNRKKSIHEINAFLFIIFLIYSFVAHISVIFACAGYFANNSRARIIALDQKVKVPYAQFVSLSGRRGNTYDRSKINLKADIDKIKNFFSQNINKIKGYYNSEKIRLDESKQIAMESLKNEEAKKSRSSIDLNESIELIADISVRAVKSLKEFKLADKKMTRGVKVKAKQKAAEPGSKKNTASRHVFKKKIIDKEKTAKKTPLTNNLYDDNSAAAQAFDDSAAGFDSKGAAPDANTVRVFGNMSGNETKGDKMAGAPHGDMDTSIEASEMDIFKSIVRKKISSKIKYPENFRRRGIEGTIRIKFEIVAGGMLDNIEILESSGNSDIDSAALEALKSAQPFVPFPCKVKQNIAFSIPLRYKLRR